MEHYFNIDLATKLGIEEAIFLHNLYYWIQKNAVNKKQFYDGSYWTYNTKQAYAELFPYMSLSKIKRIIDKLDEESIIKIGNFSEDKMNRTSWYAFTDCGLKMMENAGYKVGVFRNEENCADALGQNEPMQQPEMEQCTTNINKTDNKNKEKDKSFPKKKFVKPTVEDVDAYIKEKDYHFDAEQFWNHYESVGWMIGKNHMKDWHSACATWEGRRKQERKEKEEKEETVPNEIPADDIEAWNNNQKWMQVKTPRILKMVTYQMFAKMRAVSMWNNKLYAEVLMEIDRSGYDGDIVVEFNRLIDKHSKV